MKRIVLIITCIIITQQGFAQTTHKWLDVGTQWHYEANYRPSISGYNKYNYMKDTVIANKNFQQVIWAQQLYTITVNEKYIKGNLTYLSPKFFYTSNDTVYVLGKNNSLQFAWHNAAKKGDIWNFGLQYIPWANTYTTVYCIVDSVKSVSINGQYMKEIYSSPYNISKAKRYLPGEYGLFANHIKQINTKFGPFKGFSGINTYEWTNGSRFTPDYMPDILNCYESSTFPFYQRTEVPISFPPYLVDCYTNFFTVGTDDELNKEALKFTPTPLLMC